MRDAHDRIAFCLQDDRTHIPILPVPSTALGRVTVSRTVTRTRKHLVPRKHIPIFPTWETIEHQEVCEEEITDTSPEGLVDPLYRMAALSIPTLGGNELMIDASLFIGRDVILDNEEAEHFKRRLPHAGEFGWLHGQYFLCASVIGLR